MKCGFARVREKRDGFPFLWEKGHGIWSDVDAYNLDLAWKPVVRILCDSHVTGV